MALIEHRNSNANGAGGPFFGKYPLQYYHWRRMWFLRRRQGPKVTMRESAKILVVDDEKIIRDVLSDFLDLEGYKIHVSASAEEALTEISRQSFDLVITDLKMPGMSGIELLAQIQNSNPQTVVIIMTGFGTVETALSAMKKGAYDYVLKPFKVEEVVTVIERALSKQRLISENLRLRETVSLYKVSEAITRSLSVDDILRSVVESAVQDGLSSSASLLLEDGEGGYLERANFMSPTSGLDFALNPNAIMNGLHERDHIAVSSDGVRSYLSRMDPSAPIRGMMAVPLRVNQRRIGALVVVRELSLNDFDEGHRKLLSMIADRAASGIDNAKVHQDLQATFEQTVRGLASAIDKMDRYTHGHSERVAQYAGALAEKLGLDSGKVETVRQAALMHDIGKIGCVMNLNKPGKLSEAEYDLFRAHPQYGKDILQPIEFLHPIIPGVYLHHERWDGEGYPLGLHAQDIPIVARIITVADTYDAMTSDRAYRRALPEHIAIAELKRCKGKQFDPDIAEEFLSYLERPNG